MLRILPFPALFHYSSSIIGNIIFKTISDKGGKPNNVVEKGVKFCKACEF